ncbi:MAG: DNA polymerase I [Burkholderiales bacterium]|nr:DNA polymerase I [Burkholderiales bacterium]
MNTEDSKHGIGKTLLLVDGSSYLYRAFHALPDLRNKGNEPTGALYGVLNMLRRLHKDVRADYSACVFDAKGKTFRDDWYPEYKAHRPPMPQDLVFQIEPLYEAIRAMGWPLVVVEGVEADDVIGTLAVKAQKTGMKTVISTGDKDLAQLVNPKVTLVNTMSNEWLDEAGVSAKFGVPPDSILDYLTLVGDAVDNVPGVEKVGPKTAVKWLSQYGSLNELMAHSGDISGVVGENLRGARDWLPMAKKLLTIRCDLDLGLDWEDLSEKPRDRKRLVELYRHYEFKNWLKEIELESEEDSSSEPKAVRYETILNPGDFDAWVRKIENSPLVFLHIETTNSEPMQAELVGMAFALNEGEAAYLPLRHAYPGTPLQLEFEFVMDRIKLWLESAGKACHDAKFLKHVFSNHGIDLAGVLHDTELESYVLESHKPHELESLALRHLDLRRQSRDDITGKGAGRIGFDQVELDLAAQFACEAADLALRIHHVLFPRIEANPKLHHVYRGIEMPTLEILYRMERKGILLDSGMLIAQSRELGEKMLKLESDSYEIAGQPFNLNSPKQVQEILFDVLKLPVLKKTQTGAASTDEEVLQQLALDYPLPKLLLEYRGLAKLKSTYTDKLPKMVNAGTGRVHTTYAQAVAVTGRLSSLSPNLQNIPVRTEEGRRIREAFIAPSGYRLVSADYSQIELRIMAHISKDEGLLGAFSRGEDIHRTTASEIFGVLPVEVSPEQRRYAKVINFGLIYGMSVFGLAQELGVDRNSAQVYIDRYFSRYPGVAGYMQRTREEAKKNGYVETVFGRRLWLPEINASNGVRRAAAERAAINAPMQGTAADLIKLAMIAVQKWIDSGNYAARLVMQVHDELVLEVPDMELDSVMAALPGLMENAANLTVPLLVDCGMGLNWDEAH